MAGLETGQEFVRTKYGRQGERGKARRAGEGGKSRKGTKRNWAGKALPSPQQIQSVLKKRPNL